MSEHTDPRTSTVILENRLVFCTLSRQPVDTPTSHFFTVDDVFRYEPFFNDFGPLNINISYKFCQMLIGKLAAPELANKVIYFYCFNRPQNKSNAAVLIGIYLVVYGGRTSAQAYEPLKQLEPYMPFRDASQGLCTFRLMPQHCLRAVAKAFKLGFFDWTKWNSAEYEHFESVECLAVGTQVMLDDGSTIAVEELDETRHRLVGPTGNSLEIMHLSPVLQAPEPLLRVVPTDSSFRGHVVTVDHLVAYQTRQKDSDATVPGVTAARSLLEAQEQLSTSTFAQEHQLYKPDVPLSLPSNDFVASTLAEAIRDATSATNEAPVPVGARSLDELIATLTESIVVAVSLGCALPTWFDGADGDFPVLSRADLDQLPRGADGRIATTETVATAVHSTLMRLVAWWSGLWIAAGDEHVRIGQTKGLLAEQLLPSELPPQNHSHAGAVSRVQRLMEMLGGVEKDFACEANNAAFRLKCGGPQGVLGTFLLKSGVSLAKKDESCWSSATLGRIMCDTLDIRRAYLCGIIDGAGSFDGAAQCFTVSASPAIAEDCCERFTRFLRTLGLSVSQSRDEKQCQWTMHHTRADAIRETMECLSASSKLCLADLKDSPLNLAHSSFRLEQQSDDASRDFVRFKVYDPTKREQDGLFLLSDLTVTHNCGDLNLIIPGKFLAFAGPHATNVSPEGYPTLTPADYLPIFQMYGVKTVIRLNKKCYERKDFVNAGVAHHDLYFVDGTTPSNAILDKFLAICESAPGTIAVHCKAGLGRTGTTIGCYIMKHYHFSAAEVIAWLRLARPGCVIGPQQHYLKLQEPRMWKLGKSGSSVGTSVASSEAGSAASSAHGTPVRSTSAAGSANMQPAPMPSYAMSQPSSPMSTCSTPPSGARHQSYSASFDTPPSMNQQKIAGPRSVSALGVSSPLAMTSPSSSYPHTRSVTAAAALAAASPTTASLNALVNRGRSKAPKPSIYSPTSPLYDDAKDGSARLSTPTRGASMSRVMTGSRADAKATSPGSTTAQRTLFDNKSWLSTNQRRSPSATGLRRGGALHSPTSPTTPSFAAHSTASFSSPLTTSSLTSPSSPTSPALIGGTRTGSKVRSASQTPGIGFRQSKTRAASKQ